MIRVILLLLITNPVVAQQFTGTWTGLFSREGKSAKMQLELMEGRNETFGIFSLYSNDSAVLISRYLVLLVDSKDNKLVLRKTKFLNEKTPATINPNQVVTRNRNSNRQGSSPNDPSLTKSVIQEDVLNITFSKSMNFEQFIGKLDSSTTPNIIGKWYVTKEGINSFGRPAGEFSVQKEKNDLSEEARKILIPISK